MSVGFYPIPLGTVFGRWEIIGEFEMQGKYTKRWKCRCSCQQKTERFVNHYNLVSGKSVSCGCFKDELSRIKMTEYNATGATVRHGESYSTEYKIYHGLKTRCYAKNCKRYKNYGGRGIVMCDRWLGRDGFENFYKDMGRRPSQKHSIDRIDNDGPYSPGNCRWVTNKQQQRNRSNNRIITAFGKSMCVADWADELGLTQKLINGRLALASKNPDRWTPESILTKPVIKSTHQRHTNGN